MVATEAIVLVMKKIDVLIEGIMMFVISSDILLIYSIISSTV